MYPLLYSTLAQACTTSHLPSTPYPPPPNPHSRFKRLLCGALWLHLFWSLCFFQFILLSLTSRTTLKIICLPAPTLYPASPSVHPFPPLPLCPFCFSSRECLPSHLPVSAYRNPAHNFKPTYANLA